MRSSCFKSSFLEEAYDERGQIIDDIECRRYTTVADQEQGRSLTSLKSGSNCTCIGLCVAIKSMYTVIYVALMALGFLQRRSAIDT